MRTMFLLCAAMTAAPAMAQTAPAPTTPAPAGAPAPAGTQTAPAPAGNPAAPAPGRTPMAAPAGAPAATPTLATQLVVGAAIVDSTGASVGTVDQIAGEVVTVNTGTNKVGVPKGNFAAGPNGLVLGNTKAQLDAAASQGAAQQQAQVKAALVPGAEVHGTGGMVLGTVKSSDDQAVTVTSKQGDVRLPVSGLAVGPTGLVVGMTSAQFDAAVTAAKGK